MRSAVRSLKHVVGDIYWDFRGLAIRSPSLPPTVRSVLFICKGNICRSPFAERLASNLRAEDSSSKMRFGSAGLHVNKPISPPEDAVEAAKRFGIDLHDHRSQSISVELVESYDMIVAMEGWQYAELKSRFSKYQAKIFLLPLLAPDDKARHHGYAAYNIKDPYGAAPSIFDQCFRRISFCTNSLLRLIGPL
jgi:protein-tyrosine phosphatase